MPFSFRRHVLPPLLGVVTMCSVLALLNSQLLLAQARYHFGRPAHVALIKAAPAARQNTAIDPHAPPELNIPAINLKAPIILDETSTIEWRVQIALRHGVVHYGQTALPGQSGNAVIIGHSSGALWAPGDYKFVFTLLSKLKPGDQISLDYQGTRYTYKVKDLIVVGPTDLTILEQTAVPTLSLVTCTPVGTSKNRLVVRAAQISPTPIRQAASGVEPKKAAPVTTNLPGSDATSLWHTIRNWF